MSRKGSASSSKNILTSLMKDMNLDCKLQNEILFFAETLKTLPYVPKSQITVSHSEDFKQETRRLLKLPPRPLQRMKYEIEQAGAYEREAYRPDPSKTRPAHEKERLQNMMAFGEEFQKDEKVPKRSPKDLLIDTSELFDEILEEIKQRKEFLEDMDKLGLKKKYLSEIQGQISLRLKELEELDDARACEAYLKYGI